MGSLIGKALRPKNAAPVPYTGGQYGFSSLTSSMSGAGPEAYMRAFGTVGTVWQIVHLLSSNVAKPEWRLYRSAQQDGRQRYTTNDQGSDNRVEVIKHQALTVLGRPNPWYSRFGLFEASQQHMELAGEWFWVVEYDGRAKIPVGLWPVRPDRLDPVPDPDAYLKGWVYSSPDGREKIPLRTDEVIHGMYPNPLDSYRGIGPVQAVLVDIDAAKYSAEWNRNFFLNSAKPDGVIQVDHALDDNEWDALTERWREAHKGVGRAHRVAVLEAGATWVETKSSLKDMDFANLRNVSRDIIREAFGIHKIMLGNSDDVNRANAQTGEEVFANWSIAPRLDRWRDALNYQFLPLFGSAGQGVEFDYIYPLPQNREQDNAELTAKSAAAQVLVMAGYDPHDVLQVVGLPDMDVANTPAAAVPMPALPDQGDGGDDGSQNRRPRALPDQGDGGDDGSQNRRPRAIPAPRAAKDAGAKVVEQLAEDFPPSAMAWVHHASWQGPVKVPVSHIDPDMAWVGPADPDHVQEFVKQLKDGKKLKPVILVKTPKDARLQLSDGHHRYLAYAAVEQPVRAYIGTVDQEHGGWETMHRSQKGLGSSGSKDAKDAKQRQMAAWNALAGAR